jgi:hypothetical protein
MALVDAALFGPGKSRQGPSAPGTRPADQGCMSNQRAVNRILQEYARGFITCDEAQRRLERARAADGPDAAERMKARVLGLLGLSGQP